MERALRKTLPDGKFVGVSAQRSERMRAVRGRGNKTTEGRLRSALMRAGLRGWTLGPREIPERPDFYFDGAKLAIFADGCFWHGCPQCGHFPKVNSRFWRAKIKRNRGRDLEIVRRLRLAGYKVLRLWEHELAEMPERCVERIKRKLKRFRADVL